MNELKPISIADITPVEAVQEIWRLRRERNELKERLAAAEARAAGWQERCQQVMANVDTQTFALFNALDRESKLRAALEAVEWAQGPLRRRYCPWCLRVEAFGHQPDCQRQAALGGE